MERFPRSIQPGLPPGREIKDIVASIAEAGAPVVAGLFHGILGQVAPGAVSAYLAYRQKRSERMVEHCLESMSQRVERIEVVLAALGSEYLSFLTMHVIPMAIETAADETEERKIPLIVNGIENTIRQQLMDEGLLRTFFDLLHGLRLIELEVFASYYRGPDLHAPIELEFSDSSREYENRHLYKQYIIAKLEGFGLVTVSRTVGQMAGDDPAKYNLDVGQSELGRRFMDFIRTNNAIRV